jgi:uncharacterized protein (DUF885 family)
MNLKKAVYLATFLLTVASQGPALASSAAVSAAFAESATSKVQRQSAANSLALRRKLLNRLIQQQWEARLRQEPELASSLGDKRYDHLLHDFSQAGINAEHKRDRDFLKRFEAINPQGFSTQEKLNLDLMLGQLRLNIEETRFKKWQMPMTQKWGDHIEMAQMVGWLPFATVKDYDNYLARLKQLPILFEQNMVQMRLGMKNRHLPPQYLLEKLARQCEDMASAGIEAIPFMQPLKKMPTTFPAAEQQRLRAAITAAVTQQVVPGYQKLAKFVRQEYAPQGRQEPGLWALDDGDAWYRFLARKFTTTRLTPDEIHQLGLREVARIEALMLAVAKKQGFADLKSFNAMILANPDLHPKSGQEIIDLYRKYTYQMYQKLPQLFGRLPKGKMVVKPVEAFREKDSAGAYYITGTPDGSRPGNVMVNTGDFANRLTLSIETTALYEGVPGHHMQLTIAQELQGIPVFRRYGEYTAYVEGWALYSERLGQELGFFQDPFSYYGHLQDEMLRAIRLVVDTGVHAKKWSRQQVVDFFYDHSGIEEVEIQSETDRYIANPGQALSYKIGQLKIIELRDHASTRLGKKFDIRAFHDEILGAGPLPMDLLEQRMHAWVARQ